MSDKIYILEIVLQQIVKNGLGVNGVRRRWFWKKGDWEDAYSAITQVRNNEAQTEVCREGDRFHR